MPPLDVDHIREAARQLQESKGSVPTLKEVSDALSVSSGDVRAAVNNARRAEKCTWESLGIQPGIVSKERLVLRKTLESLTSDGARVRVIAELLDLATAGKLSTGQVRVLVYALRTGESLYKRLDVPYAERFGLDPHHVSNTLHKSRREPRVRPGTVGVIDQYVRAKIADSTDHSPTAVRCRQFFVNAVSYFRACAQDRLFSTFLRHGAGNTEAARLIASSWRVRTKSARTAGAPKRRRNACFRTSSKGSASMPSYGSTAPT